MAVVFGRTSAGTTADFSANGHTAVWPFTAGSSGTVRSIRAQTKAGLGNSATVCRLGIYADNGSGLPGALLGVADAIGNYNGAGVHGANLATPINVTAGTQYWIGWYANEQRDFEGSSGGAYRETQAATNFPDPFGATNPSSVDAIVWADDAEFFPEVQYITGALGGTTTTTSFTITIPTVQVGDLLVLEFAHRGTGNGSVSDNDTGGEAWTRKGGVVSGSVFSVQQYYKRATSATSGKIITGSSLTNSCAAVLTVYRYATPTGDPFEVWTSEQNASGDEAHAEITTLTDNAMVCLVVGNAPDLAISTQSTTSPGALTEKQERLSTGGSDSSISHASALKATAGATGSLTWAQTNSDSLSLAYAIVPQVPAGTEYTDSGTAVLKLTPSATEGRESSDAATALLKLTPSGTEAFLEIFEFTEARFPAESCEIGPWKAPNGSFYTILRSPSSRNHFQIFKASDPTSAWSRAGTLLASTRIIDESCGLSARLVGNIIHIAYAGLSGGVGYSAFDTSSDTWSVSDESASTGNGNLNFAPVGIGVRSDGDIIVLFTYDEGAGNTTVRYSRREGGTWTRNVTVATGGFYYSGPVIHGASDRMHFVYLDVGTQLFVRTLSSANALATQQSVSVDVLDNLVGPGLSYDGDSKIRVLFNSATNELMIGEWADADNPSPTEAIVTGTSVTNDDGPYAGIGASGQNVHVIFADDATKDIWHDVNTGSGWGTDVEIQDAVTASKMSASVLQRATTVLGYVWANNLVPQYNELTLPGVFTDADTAVLRLTPITADIAQFADTDTAKLTFTPNATELREQFDAATVPLALIASGTDQLSRQYTDADTLALALTPSATELREQFDAATAFLDLQPSGVDVAEFADSAIATLLYTPSGIELREIADAATIPLLLLPSSADIADYNDADTTRLTLTPSGTETMSGEATDAGTLDLLLGPSSSDIAAYLDSVTVPLALSPSAVDIAEFIDTALASLLLTPSASELLETIDAAQPVVVLTPNAADVAVFVDSAIVPLLFSPSSVEEYTRFDTGTVPLLLTPSAVAVAEYVDVLTALLKLTPSQVLEGDAGTLDFKLTPITVVEIRFLFDTLLAATVYQHWSMTVEQKWSATVTSKWFGIMLNRLWAGTLIGSKWTASVKQRWSTVYKGRG